MYTIATKQLASAYHKLLSTIDWNDLVLVNGLREGLNKFLSNAHLSLLPGKNKYHKSHYITDAALTVLNAGSCEGLIFEHIVPKTRYLQEPCEFLARQNKLTLDQVETLIGKYWKIATITTQEDLLLRRSSMPDEWDQLDIFARYKKAGIQLLDNPYFCK